MNAVPCVRPPCRYRAAAAAWHCMVLLLLLLLFLLLLFLLFLLFLLLLLLLQDR